jgi:hypothetical protein
MFSSWSQSVEVYQDTLTKSEQGWDDSYAYIKGHRRKESHGFYYNSRRPTENARVASISGYSSHGTLAML